MKRSGGMFSSVLLVSFFTVLTAILNYLIIVLLAARFGAAGEMDAFFAATTIPQLITAMLVASLTTTFIPVFIEALSKDEGNAWKTGSISTNILFILLSFIAAMSILWAKEIVALVSPGFIGGTRFTATALFRILMLAIVFSGTSIILTSIYYSYQKYFVPSAAQALNSLIALLFVVFAVKTYGIKSIAIGTLLGSVVQFFVLLPILLKRGRYSFDFDLRKREVVRLGALMLPLLAGSTFYKANALVERYIASKLGESNISYLGYAFKIISIFQLVFTQGLSTAILPRLSEQAARKDLKGLRETISKGLRAMILIVVPMVFVLVLARTEVVRIIFERGDFTRQTTDAVARALLAYLGFFVVGLISVPIVNTLYSLQKTALVATIGVSGFIFYVFLAFFLAGRFSYPGIALAVSIQYVVNVSVFFLIIKKKVGCPNISPLLRCIFKSTLASGCTYIVLIIAKALLEPLVAYPWDFMVLASGGIIVYILFLILFKSREIKIIPLKRITFHD
jgi:putative peptidoglycan lipid II flippase